MHNSLMPETIAVLAGRPMRLGHYLWHRSRDVWTLLTPAQQLAFERKFGWKPPPSLTADRRPIFTHPGPGRDFLYMHRRMIQHVNHLQHCHDGHPPRGFERPPPVGDLHYPVPPRPPGLDGKNDVFWQLMIDRFNDRWSSDGFATISEFGTYVEYGIHAAMHERFCDQPDRERTDPPLGDSWPMPGSRWDAPGYDYLLDMYAAHVNPVFWSIHVWIDSYIDAWEARRGRIDWAGAWEGPMDHSHPSGPCHDDDDDDHGGHIRIVIPDDDRFDAAAGPEAEERMAHAAEFLAVVAPPERFQVRLRREDL